MNIAEYMQDLGAKARQASRVMAAASTEKKNRALLAMAEAIDTSRDALAKANAVDLEKGAANGLDAAMLDRLELTPARIDGMIEGLRQVAALPDPVGDVSDMRYMPSGIQLGKMRVPLGVIGIIYESRPNVTVEAASLCLKSGNATILRGGSEAIESNQAIAACVTAGLKAAGLPEAGVQVVETTDRAAVGSLITMPEYVDVIVPRGGKGLIERISNEARVPVIKHLDARFARDKHARLKGLVAVTDVFGCQRQKHPLHFSSHACPSKEIEQIKECVLRTVGDRNVLFCHRPVEFAIE